MRLIEEHRNREWYSGYVYVESRIPHGQDIFDRVRTLAYLRSMASETGLGYAFERGGSYMRWLIGAIAADRDDGVTYVDCGACYRRARTPPTDHTMASNAGMPLLSKLLHPKTQASKLRTKRIELESKAAMMDERHTPLYSVVTDARIWQFIRPNPTSMLVLSDYLDETGISVRHAEAIRLVQGDPCLSYTALCRDL